MTISKPSLASHFVTKTRTNGETFVTLNDDAPEWLRTAVQEAHCGDGPGDWIYAECLAVCEAIDAGDLPGDDESDAIHEYSDRRVDIYTQELFQWAANSCLSNMYAAAESEAAEMGAEGAVETQLRAIQYCAIQTIVNVIVEAAKEHR